MYDKLTSEGLTIAPGVVETIISLAVSQVEGVAQVRATGLPNSFMSVLSRKQQAHGIIIMADDDNQITVAVHVCIYYGYRLQEVAEQIRRVVSNTFEGQIGIEIARVDVYVDGIQFPE